MALSADRQTLSRYHESGERLTTPMMAGVELKAKKLRPMENSRTFALAAARWVFNNPANCSRDNISVRVTSAGRIAGRVATAQDGFSKNQPASPATPASADEGDARCLPPPPPRFSLPIRANPAIRSRSGAAL